MPISRSISNSHYYRDSFLRDDEERNLYDLLQNAIASHQMDVYPPKLPSNERFSFIFQAVCLDNPQFWDFAFCVQPSVRNNLLSLRKGYCGGPVRNAQFDQAVQAILSEAEKITDEYERAVYVSDYLEKSCHYDEKIYSEDRKTTPTPEEFLAHASSFTMYGPLVEKKGVCTGFSLAYAYLLFRLGIPVVSIAASGKIGHCFNAVSFGGEWTNIDMTLTIRKAQFVYHDREAEIEPLLRLGFGLPDREFPAFGLSSNEFHGVESDHLNYWVHAGKGFSTFAGIRFFVEHLAARHEGLVLVYRGDEALSEILRKTQKLLNNHGIVPEGSYYANNRYLIFLGGTLYGQPN